MKRSLVLIALLSSVAASAQIKIRLCDTCPDPPAIDLSRGGDEFYQQFSQAFNDNEWLLSPEAAKANRLRMLNVDTVLMSINVPVLQRFEFMSKIYQHVIADYRTELAKVELDARKVDNSDDPTGFAHQATLRLKGRKPDFKAIIAEKKRNLERVIENRNKEMGELTEMVQ
jgi:hypothetical protein